MCISLPTLYTLREYIITKRRFMRAIMLVYSWLVMCSNTQTLTHTMCVSVRLHKTNKQLSWLALLQQNNNNLFWKLTFQCSASHRYVFSFRLSLLNLNQSTFWHSKSNLFLTRFTDLNKLKWMQLYKQKYVRCWLFSWSYQTKTNISSHKMRDASCAHFFYFICDL